MYETQSGCGWCPYEATVWNVTLVTPLTVPACTVGGKLVTHDITYQVISTIAPAVPAAIPAIRRLNVTSTPRRGLSAA